MGNPVSALLELFGSKSDGQSAIARRARRIGKLNELERVALYKYIGSRVRAGHAVGGALQKLLGTQYIRKTSRMKAAIEVAIHKFSRGAKLAVALQAFIPAMEYMLILTGDQSGSLPDTLAQLSDSIIRDRKMRRSFRKSLMPSLMLLIFGVLAIFGTALFIVPQYRGVLKPKEVHGFAAFVLATSTPTGLASLVALVLGVFAGLIWLMRAARTVDAPWRRWLENIPNSPFAFYRDWNSLLCRAASHLQLRARDRRGRIDGDESCRAEDDSAAGHAAHRHHAGRDRVFLAALAADVFQFKIPVQELRDRPGDRHLSHGPRRRRSD
jgi:hypothetical protein